MLWNDCFIWNLHVDDGNAHKNLPCGWTAIEPRLVFLKPRPNDRNMPTQHIPTLLDATCCVRLATVLRHVGCCCLKFENGSIWANNTQHVTTGWLNAGTMLRYVGLACCDRFAGALAAVWSPSSRYARLGFFHHQRFRVWRKTFYMWKHSSPKSTSTYMYQ